MKTSVTIDGWKELEDNLKTLGSRVERGVIRKAVRSAQGIMLRAVQSRARALHRDTGRLYVAGKKGEQDISMAELIARNLEIRSPRRQIRGTYALHVMMRPGVADFYHVAQGAHSKVDYAHKNRHGQTVTKRGGVVGLTYIPSAIEYGHGASKETAARPFMRPASDTTQNERLRRVADELRVGILREAIKGRYAGGAT